MLLIFPRYSASNVCDINRGTSRGRVIEIYSINEMRVYINIFRDLNRSSISYDGRVGSLLNVKGFKVPLPHPSDRSLLIETSKCLVQYSLLWPIGKAAFVRS